MADPIAIAKAAAGTIGQLRAFLEECKDRNVSSLTEYTKKTNIISRIYIEEGLANESATIPLIKMINQIYSGLVFSALGMGDMIAGGKTVRQLMSVVSTENYSNFTDVVKNEFGASKEDLVALEGNQDSGDKQWKDMEASSAALFSGRLLEVTVGGKDGAKLYFYIQLLPYLTPSSVMESFVTLNFTPPVQRRWWAYKAGEISFWKDFVFEADKVAKRKKAIIADKDGVLREMEARKQSGVSKALSNFATTSGNMNRNAANSIIIMSKQTLDRVSKENGFDIRRYDQRQTLFKDTMSMIFAVYDNLYNTVDMYFNGLESRGEYTTDMLEKAAKKGDSGLDLKTLITLLTNGNAPRF